MTKLHLDFETFSKANLKKVGTSRYSRDPSTEILLLGWKLDDEPVDVVRFAEGQRAPKILRDALRDPDVRKFAWNSPFEKAILQNVAGIEIFHDEWVDPTVLAYSLSFPGSLEDVGNIIGIGEDKKKSARGKALIRMFCQPQKPTKKAPYDRKTHLTHPEEWEEFVEYCARDVEAEEAIYEKLKKWDMPAHEWRLWYLDQKINNAGIPIRMQVVHNAIKIASEVVEKRIKEMKEITGLANPNSGKHQLLPWLKEQGYPFDDLKKAHVKKALETLEESPENRDLIRVLELRQEVSKSSVKKYNALAEATDEDGMLRNAFQFNGAQRTHRWGGRKYQPQNLAKPVPYLESVQAEAVRDLELLDTESIELLYHKPMDLLSTCVRPVVQAIPGHLLADADLSAIENRVLGWLADDQKILNVFRKGRDPYVDFATYMTGRTYDDLWHEYKVLGKKENRTLAKPATLGCGFLLGPGEFRKDPKTGEVVGTGLLGYAQSMGVTMTPKQSEHAVRTFRETFTGVKSFWYDLDKAMRRCIRTKQPQRVGFITFDATGPFVRMGLPSGSHLYYYKPRIEERKTPWGEVRPTITYEGLNDKSQWVRLSTHPGKITENAVQKVARDVLAHGMTLADKRGFDIRLHVHDEIVTMEPKEVAHDRLEILCECMSKVPKWAPGLILGAEGEVSHAFFKT